MLKGMIMTVLKNMMAAGNILRLTIIGTAALITSACVYPDQRGFYDDGFGFANNAGFNGGFCDPFDPYDAFYNCDFQGGFGQIGFGGGYFDNFYYPGFGIHLFDRPGGRRFLMQQRHRNYWAQQRFQFAQIGRNNRGNFRNQQRFERQGARRDDRQDARRDARRDDRQDARRDDRQDARRDARRQARIDERDNGNIDNGNIVENNPFRQQRQARPGRSGNGNVVENNPFRQQRQARPENQARPERQPRPANQARPDNRARPVTQAPARAAPQRQAAPAPAAQRAQPAQTRPDRPRLSPNRREISNRYVVDE